MKKLLLLSILSISAVAQSAPVKSYFPQTSDQKEAVLEILGAEEYVGNTVYNLESFQFIPRIEKKGALAKTSTKEFTVTSSNDSQRITVCSSIQYNSKDQHTVDRNPMLQNLLKENDYVQLPAVVLGCHSHSARRFEGGSIGGGFLGVYAFEIDQNGNVGRTLKY